MGDPKKIKSKFKGPSHPWQRLRIETEKALQKTYGLKSKTEIWKASSEVRRLTSQAKKLIRDRNSRQSKLEQKQLIESLFSQGLLHKDAVLEDVLALTTANLLDRRLQALVFKKGFSLTIGQARQFIIHGHIYINGKKVTVPSYHVLPKEENSIEFNPNSSLASPEHPERTKEKKDKDNKKGKTDDEVAKELEELKKIEEKVGTVEA